MFVLFFAISIYAQSADVITDVLESEKATFGQVCYLAAVQKNLINEKASYSDAVKALYDNHMIVTLEDADAYIPAVDIAYIFSQLWEVKGGLMYRLTKGAPRYAFKQFVYDGIIDSGTDTSTYLSGAKVLSMYTACSRKYGAFKMSDVSMEAE